jgi:hypothetical protein
VRRNAAIIREIEDQHHWSEFRQWVARSMPQGGGIR